METWLEIPTNREGAEIGLDLGALERFQERPRDLEHALRDIGILCSGAFVQYQGSHVQIEGRSVSPLHRHLPLITTTLGGSIGFSVVFVNVCFYGTRN